MGKKLESALLSNPAKNSSYLKKESSGFFA